MRIAATLAIAFALAFGAAARADGVSDLGAEVARLDRARTEVESRRATLEKSHREEARAIERLKAEAPGVARDYQLGQRLASAQERALELDRLQADLRGRDEEISRVRRTLIEACDRALDDRKVPDAQRVEIARRRAAESARFAEIPASGGGEIARPVADPLDGPAELDDKADLLRDSEERLQREADRLGRRIDGVESRRRLRERANDVDDDLFVESGTGRRTVRLTPIGAAPRDAKSDGAQATPMAGVGTNNPAPTGGTTLNNLSGGGEADGRFGVSLRSVIDPSTVDDLRRAEVGSDLDGQLRALRRMQGGLKALADDLGRRESDLRKRAREIRPRK